MEVEVSSDGRTVWVNGLTALIGRFSKMGIDVHVDGTCAGDGCVPGPCTKEHWETFKTQMLAVHNVVVTDDHMPKYLESS